VLDELELRLPETFDSVITEVAPGRRVKLVVLAVIAGAGLTVTEMFSVVLLSRTVICAVPVALALTLIFPLDRLAVAIFELLVVTLTEPDTLFSATTDVVFMVSAKVAGAAVIAVVVSDRSRSARAGCERNTNGAISTASPRMNLLYVIKPPGYEDRNGGLNNPCS
jgi:hypothetical protein